MPMYWRVGVYAFFILFSTIACSADNQPEPAPENSAQAAMNDFVGALRKKDLAALSAFFPENGVWTLQGTMGGPEMSSQHSGVEVREAMRTERGVYDALIDSEGDTLRDLVMEGPGTVPWTQLKPGFFVPRESSGEPISLYIRWRQELGRWVIDVIGVPFA